MQWERPCGRKNILRLTQYETAFPHAFIAEQADLQDELLKLQVDNAYAKQGISVQTCSNCKIGGEL